MVADWIETPSETSAETAARNSAQGILRAAAFDLSSLAENVAERLHLRGTRFVVAKMGGMIGRSKYLESQIDERLRNAFPQAQIGSLRVSPAEAAARLALRLLSGGASAGS
jgi:N-acetylglucosamine kinase-like BadF-type ATPase